MASCILTISERPEDLAFGQSLAQFLKIPFEHANTPTQVSAAYAKQKNTVALWDVDHPGATQSNHPLSVQKIAQSLVESADPARVIAVSSQPLNEIPHVLTLSSFDHHLFRQYADPCVEVVARLLRAPRGNDLTTFLPAGAAVKKIALKSSQERVAATEAMNNVMSKLGLPPRLVSLVAQAADELLMNAIFDAPEDSSGNSYRRSTPRTEAFALQGREAVEMELGTASTYGILSVTDHFGSLKKDKVFSFLRRDYDKQKYRLREGDPGAGLGLYGMFDSGLSLLFDSEPGARTTVLLFFPMTRNFKTFRSGFRFFSIRA